MYPVYSVGPPNVNYDLQELPATALVKSKDCVVRNGVAKNRPGKHVGWMVGLQGHARKPNQTR